MIANGFQMLFSAFIVFTMSSTVALDAGQDITGVWRTYDDKSGATRGTVRISEENGEFVGRIENSPRAADRTARCEKCPGDRKGKPLIGLVIIRGLRRQGSEYTGGQLLDAYSGSLYRCKARLSADGKSLFLRRYLGISIFWRSTTWTREGVTEIGVRAVPSKNRYYSGQANDHFDGLRFFNPNHPDTDRSLADILRWRLRERAAAWPRAIPVLQTVPTAEVTGLRATIVGHATVLIQSGGLNVLTDPVWSERASPVAFAGPRRVSAPGIAFDDLPPIHAILLSHNHYDHMDIPTLRRLNARHRPLIVTPLGNDTILRRAIPGVRVITGDWWDTIDIGRGVKVTIVPAYHWSSRALRDRRMALWSGFMIQTAGGSAYFAGDTGYGDGQIFREMRTRLGRPDLALIPIGAYAPRWFMREQHVDPDEAVRIMETLGAVRAVGIHWGTFQLTNEPWAEPPELLLDALLRHGIAPGLFPAGEPGLQYETRSMRTIKD